MIAEPGKTVEPSLYLEAKRTFNRSLTLNVSSTGQVINSSFSFFRPSVLSFSRYGLLFRGRNRRQRSLL